MNSIRFALLVLLVGSVGACGGRSALKVSSSHDGGESNDGGGASDGKRDGIVNLDGLKLDSAGDASKDALPPGDASLLDGPRAEVAADAVRLDGVTVQPDTRVGGADVPILSDGNRDGAVLADIRPEGPGDVAPTLSSIQLSPPSPTLVVGVPYSNLVVTALMSDNTSTDVTATATFTSSNPAIVQVSGHTLNGLAAGTATVTATYLGRTATATVTVSASPPQSLSIDGVTPVQVGGFIPVTATMVFANGTKQDVTAQATWTSADVTLATVALDSATAKERINGIKAGTTTVSATLLGITAAASVTVTASPMTRIDITPPQAIIQRGVSQQFKATATFQDNTTADVTMQATWSTSNATVAAISAGTTSEIVQASSVGTATISATVGTIVGTASVTVTQPALVSVAVAPLTWSPSVGGTQPFTATATYADNSTADVTISAAWSSTATTIVAVSNANGQEGQATALAAGTAQVQATFSGMSGSANVTVSDSPITSIAVSPAATTVVLGLKTPLAAIGRRQNGTTVDVSAQVAWSVVDGAIASVSNAAGTAGQVTGIAVGTTTVLATLASAGGPIQSKAAVTVINASLKAIAVTPATATVTAGNSQQFKATGTYDDGSTPDITLAVTWTSSAINIAQISNAAGSNGLASTLVAGAATITATLNGIVGTAALTVGRPTLSSIMISPSSADIDVGANQSFTVTAVLDNGTTTTVTAESWTSSNTTVATIAAAGGGGPGAAARGVATGVAAGTTTITATYQGKTDTALLTVTSRPTLVGIQVTPQNPASIRIGVTQAFQANGIMSDGTTTNVTGTASWTTSDATIASISSGGGGGPGGGRGVATGIGAGTVTITATYQGFTDTSTLTVRGAQQTGLEITPATATIQVNGTQAFTAQAVMDDGTTTNVTNTASWTTSDGTIASISSGGGGPGGGGRGNATGVAAGTVTITATSNGFTATASLTVQTKTPKNLVVTPAVATIIVNGTQAFVATLVYTDNTSAVVTGQATWSSSDPSVATITTAGGGGPFGGGGGGGGNATSYATGTTTITATYLGLSGTATLTVTDPPLSYVQVTPTNPNIPVQGAVQFTATAVFSDNSTRNVTAQSTWSSSTSSVALVANTGRATGIAEGTSTITATYGGMSGTSLLTVARNVDSIAVTPTNPTTVLGLPVTFTATATLSNGATLVVTGNASWVASDATIATVTGGVATPVKAGTTTVTATYLGVAGASVLTVSPTTLSSIAITPNPVSLSLATGASQQLTATGTYADSTKRDLSGVVTWRSGTSSVATVSNANGSRGLVTGIAAGTSAVTAAFQGVTSAPDTVTVTQ
jgi:hypothetical protein